MGANERGVGNLTVYHGVIAANIATSVEFLDDSQQVISSGPLDLSISLTNGSALVTNPDQSTPYRYVRILSVVAGAITIDAVETANLDCQSAPGGVVGGFEFWAKGDSGISVGDAQAVSQWTNQADGGIYNISQSTGSAQPTYYSTTAANLINFNPALSFDGSNDQLANTSRLLGNTSGFQIIVVGTDRAASTATGRGLLGMGASANAPALSLQTDATSPNGWNPNMVSGSPTEWGGGSAVLYNGNGGGSNQQPQLFMLGSSNASTSATNNIVSSVDGFQETTTLDAQRQTQIGNGLFVGSSSAGKWSGLIGEVMIYNRQLTSTELQKIQSYLAIKYGITLDSNLSSASTNFDYLASNGTTIWSGTSSASYQSYHHTITAIGRDDTDTLDQRKSKSVNAGALLTLDNGGAFSADRSFLIAGDNNASSSFATSVSGIAGVSTRMARVWKVAETGTVGAVRVGIPNTTSFSNSSKLLIVSNDGVFDGSGETTYTLTNDGTNWSTQVDLTNGQFFTFASGNPPAAPSITTPAAAGSTNATPIISGSAEAGSTVTVYEGATTICSTVADSNGAWSCTPTTPLSDGSHSFTATATTISGTSPASAARTFTVDTSAPSSAPSITSPADGNSTSDTTPTFSGTGAEAGSTVTVKEGSTVLCTATADGSGNWSCTPSTPLDAGPHSVTVTATDAAGNTGPASSPHSFAVDTSAPAAPSVSSPSNNGTTNDTTPTFAGTAEAGSTVTVKEGSTVLCTATADSSGNWSCTPSTPLSATGHTITVTATDAANNTSSGTESSFTIDTSAVSTPNLLSPSEGAHTNDTTPTFVGTADANVTVTVTLAENSTILCTDVADGSGNWSCTSSALAEGTHTVTAVAKNASNTESDPTTRIFTVDTTPPTSTPSISSPTDSTNDTTPAFSGTGAEAGSTVTVKEGSTVLCTATADSSGNWSCTPSTPLPDDTHTVTATVSDAAGNGGPTSDPLSFTVDTSAPATPTISSPAAASTTNNTHPIFSGTAEAGSTVAVQEGSSTLCTATTDGSGNWSCTPSTSLGEGGHTVTAAATDAANNTGTTSTPRSFTIDSVSPTTPSITEPAAGSSTNDTTPTFSGTGAEAGSTVTVKEGSSVLCTATAEGSGAWSCTPSTPLGAGPHSVTVTATDAAGNIGPASSPRTFTVDTSAPAAPSVSSPSSNGTTNDTTPTFAGTAEPDSTVTVKEGSTVLCTATADSSGNWSCTPSTPLASGSHSVTVTTSDAAGNGSTGSTVDFTIDTSAVSTPSILSPNEGAYTNDTTPTFAGMADANVTVTVKEGSTVLCTATANGSGSWSCSSSTLAEGSHTITAMAKNASNTESDPATRTFIVDTTAPSSTPSISSPTDDSTTNDSTPTFSGSGAEPGSTVTVQDGSSTLCTAMADSSGNWSCTPSTPLADGTHTVTALINDAAGNDGPSSDPLSFTVDTSAPAAPTIDSPAAGAVTNKTAPTFSGTAEPGSTVAVQEGSSTLCTATADSSGNWSCTPGTTLANGAHSVTATATDAANNTSAASAPSSFTVDTSAVSTPLIITPAAAAHAQGTNLNVAGTADADVTVTVKEGSTTLCTATADSSGNWSCTPSPALGEGSHTISAVATNASAQDSTAATRTFTVDNTPPSSAPSITSPAASARTNDTTPTFSGTNGEPGGTVVVKEGSSIICTASVDTNGSWECTPSTPLSQGSHTVTAAARDAAGNTGPASAGRSFTVDSQAPTAPVILSPGNGAAPNSAGLTFGGTAEPGSTVTVKEGSSVLCTAVTNSNGNWQCSPSTPLSEGSHTITATATDATGNTSSGATPVTFTINISPLFVSIATLSNMSVITDTTPLISGLAKPDSIVTLVIDPDNDTATNNSITYQTPVQSDGTWSVDTGTAVPTSGTMSAKGFVLGSIITITATDWESTNTNGVSKSVAVRVGIPMFLPILAKS